MVFKLRDAVVVSSKRGCILQRKVSIDDIHRHPDGSVYFHVSAVKSYCMSLFADKTASTKERMMSRTDIFDILMQMRNEAVAAELEKIRVALGGNLKVHRRIRMEIKNRLPKTLTISLPELHDIGAHEMSIEVTPKKCGALYVQLTSQNLMYIRSRALCQIHDGSFKRQKQEKKHDEGAGDVDEGDSDPDSKDDINHHEQMSEDRGSLTDPEDFGTEPEAVAKPEDASELSDIDESCENVTAASCAPKAQRAGQSKLESFFKKK